MTEKLTIRQWMRTEGVKFKTRAECVDQCVAVFACTRAAANSRYRDEVAPMTALEGGREARRKRAKGLTVGALIRQLDHPGRLLEGGRELGDRMLTDEEARREFLPDLSRTKFSAMVREFGFVDHRVQAPGDNVWYWGSAESVSLIRDTVDAV